MLAHNASENPREDARDALIKLDEETKKNPEFVTNAYQTTQPVPMYDFTAENVQEQDLLSSIQKICPGCGLKMCRCGQSLKGYGNSRSLFSQGDGA